MLDLNGGSKPELTEDGGSGGKEKQQRLVA
jgi:hypothetical protein